jgi:hypothetical protein
MGVLAMIWRGLLVGNRKDLARPMNRVASRNFAHSKQEEN